MKITIIGAGNMGGAIARGLTYGNMIKAENITVTAATSKSLDIMKEFNPAIHTTTDNRQAIKDADIIMIAVKPWLIDHIAGELKPVIDIRKQIIVSIVAGVPFSHLTDLFKDKNTTPSLYRVIPNTAISIRESMTAIAAFNTTEEQDKLITDIFNELGKSVLIEERLMTAATALCSCGTAFALRYIRAAMEGGIELGLYAEQAREIVAQTVKGAAGLLLQNKTHPEAEIDKVTTPGGITIKGLNEMEEAGFTTAVIKGLKAAK